MLSLLATLYLANPKIDQNLNLTSPNVQFDHDFLTSSPRLRSSNTEESISNVRQSQSPTQPRVSHTCLAGFQASACQASLALACESSGPETGECQHWSEFVLIAFFLSHLDFFSKSSLALLVWSPLHTCLMESAQHSRRPPSALFMSHNTLRSSTSIDIRCLHIHLPTGALYTS